MQYIISNLLKIFQKKWHAISFTLLGSYVIGGSFYSLRLYMPFLLGLVLVWSIPITTNFLQKISALTLVLGLLVAQMYYYNLQPALEVRTLPIAAYQQKFFVQNKQVPLVVQEKLLTRFKKDVDLSEKIPGVNFDDCINNDIAQHFFLHDFKYTYPWLNLSNTWCVSSKAIIALDYQIPVVVALSVINAKESHFWRQGIFYVSDKHGNVESVHGDGRRYSLKDYRDATIFFPFINDKDQHWLYMESWGYGVFIPFILLLIACFLCDWYAFKINPTEPLMHFISFGMAFMTVMIPSMFPYWHIASPAEVVNSNVNFYQMLYAPIWSCFNQDFLWCVLNKILLPISNVILFLPLLCMYVANLLFLKLLKILFNEKMAYVTWAVLIGLPWLALTNIGLDVYRHLYVIHSPLMLGFPLYCFGLAGFLNQFKTVHAISLVCASLCHPVLGSAVCVLFLYKHLPRQRYIYFSITIVLCFLFLYKRGLKPFAFDNPLSLYIYSSLHSVAKKQIAQQALAYLTQAYNLLFGIFVLIPNILVAFKDTSLTWRRLSRVALMMHGVWLFEGALPVDVWIASTFSAVSAIHFYQPIYSWLIVAYAKFTTTSKFTPS